MKKQVEITDIILTILRRLLIVFLLSLKTNFLFGSATEFTRAKWITVGYREDTKRHAAPIFYKTFIFSGKMNEARLYITALGIYEARLNGVRVGRNYFTPGFTVYTRRLQYQSYDVKHLLKKGKNVLEIVVADGWYRGVFRNLTSDTSGNNFGLDIALLVELKFSGKQVLGDIAHKKGLKSSGMRSILASDTSWRCAESEIRYSELYDGEMYDSRFIPKCWKPVRIIKINSRDLVLANKGLVRRGEIFEPIKIILTPNGERVIDFGQNMAGWVRFSVKGNQGDTVKVYHAETLDSLGNFYTGNLRNAKAIDTYILNGKKQQIEPHFTYHGFRYVKVEGMKPSADDIKAIALYSDLKKTGTFSCSSPMLNQLQSNIEWSMKSNFFDIPTDCPQRSERLGWTGDAQVFAGTASFLRDTKSFYQKWLADVAVEQGRNGAVPNFVPTSSPYRDEFNGVAGWGDAVTIMPWRLFEVYGDTAMLREQYPMMKKWVDYITSVSPDGLWKNKGYGDWYALGDSTSVHYINQCFYAHSTDLLVRAARVLGKSEDASSYGNLSKNIRTAFMGQYWEKGLLGTDTQTAYVLALEFGLLPDSLKSVAVERLVELIRMNGNKLATGFLGTPYLLKVLSDNGHTEVAYRLLFQKECPSWLYPITKGATTIWERWDAIRSDGSVQETSFNHYAYGAVGQWMYENVLGILPDAPGYGKVVVKPVTGGGLTWAKGSYESNYGKIEVSWKLKGNKVILKLEVPKEITAEVYVPGRSQSQLVGRGKHRFTEIILKQQLFN